MHKGGSWAKPPRPRHCAAPLLRRVPWACNSLSRVVGSWLVWVTKRRKPLLSYSVRPSPLQWAAVSAGCCCHPPGACVCRRSAPAALHGRRQHHAHEADSSPMGWNGVGRQAIKSRQTECPADAQHPCLPSQPQGCLKAAPEHAADHRAPALCCSLGSATCRRVWPLLLQVTDEVAANHKQCGMTVGSTRCMSSELNGRQLPGGNSVVCCTTPPCPWPWRQPPLTYPTLAPAFGPHL